MRIVPQPESDHHDRAALLLLLGLVALVLLTSGSYAISNDEPVQHRYGELILAYYASGLTDQAVFRFENLHLYGGLFDLIAIGISRLFPLDLWLIRHLLCAFVGIGGIVAAWATARLIAGPRAGLFAAAALSICGVWYGGMFNHTKDVPFASAMMGAIYFLLRSGRDLPRPQLRHVAGFGTMLGAALGLRAMGLLLLGYAAVAVMLQPAVFQRRPLPERVTSVARGAAVFLPALAIGYLMMIVAWPWSALNAINPILAIISFSQMDYNIPTLFAGQSYEMSTVPRVYVAGYLLVKLPLLVLSGALLVLAIATWSPLWQRSQSTAPRIEVAFVACAALLPVLLHAALRGPAFSGLRHFLFVVPPISVLAGIGFDLALRLLSRWRKAALPLAYGLLAAAVLWPTFRLVQLHPHQYLDFNVLAGGLRGAIRTYDTDYWVNIMPEAVRALEAHIARLERDGRPAKKTYTVGVCGEKTSFEHEKTLGLRLVTTEDWDNADFFIAPTHNACDARNAGRMIARIERMSALIGVVKEVANGIGINSYDSDP
ncbi:MAG: glycosyltransferase family 39 protein [Hyphomicrobiales bacterium]|nr:glycosyltransferase family 39 protein [Hyphomicrobiales bacterium]